MIPELVKGFDGKLVDSLCVLGVWLGESLISGQIMWCCPFQSIDFGPSGEPYLGSPLIIHCGCKVWAGEKEGLNPLSSIP